MSIENPLRFDDMRIRKRLDISEKLMIVQTLMEMGFVDEEGNKKRIPRGELKILARKIGYSDEEAKKLRYLFSSWKKTGQLKQLAKKVTELNGIPKKRRKTNWKKLEGELIKKIIEADEKDTPRQEVYKQFADEYNLNAEAVRMKTLRLVKKGLLPPRYQRRYRKKYEEIEEIEGGINEYVRKFITLMKNQKIRISIDIEFVDK
ncbi:MAG: hypothetical protein ACTSXD_13545 [Candidatus Heimdallarchaeaceae archaeon]